MGGVGFVHYDTPIRNRDNSYYYGGVDKGIVHVHQLQNLYFALTGKELS